MLPVFMSLFLVIKEIYEVGEIFQRVTNPQKRMKIIDERLKILEKILPQLSISPSKVAQIEFVLAVSKNNFNYLSSYNPFLIENSIEYFLQQTRKDEKFPVVGNFVSNAVNEAKSKHQSVLQNRVEYKKSCQMGKVRQVHIRSAKFGGKTQYV